jgi:hypothetical protein
MTRWLGERADRRERRRHPEYRVALLEQPMRTPEDEEFLMATEGIVQQPSARRSDPSRVGFAGSAECTDQVAVLPHESEFGAGIDPGKLNLPVDQLEVDDFVAKAR